MSQVSLGGVSYEVYSTEAEVKSYLAAAVHGTAWAAGDGTTKKRAHISAARMMDRAGLRDPATGAAITSASATVPQAVKDAEAELALVLLSDATGAVQNSLGSGSNVKSESKTERVEGAITVSSDTTYFVRTLGAAGRFPKIVQELLGPYLGGNVDLATALGPTFTGLDEIDPLFVPERDYGFTREGLP